MSEWFAPLAELLREAQTLGFVGPGPVEPHLHHAEAFASAVSDPPERAVDLGSGAGLPGLVLAGRWPSSSWRLVESNQRRAGFLSAAIDRLGLADRVVVDPRRAEEVGRDLQVRGQSDLVVARSFGPPAVVAECGAPLLTVGGQLVVSEPPRDDPGRWPAAGVAELGLLVEPPESSPGAVTESAGGAAPRTVRLRLVRPCPERFPRRVGVPGKRLLF